MDYSIEQANIVAIKTKYKEGKNKYEQKQNGLTSMDLQQKKYLLCIVLF